MTLLVASYREVRGLVQRHRLHGRGIGSVDVHLLASCVLTSDARLWTRDRRLAAAAGQLDVLDTVR